MKKCCGILKPRLDIPRKRIGTDVPFSFQLETGTFNDAKDVKVFAYPLDDKRAVVEIQVEVDYEGHSVKGVLYGNTQTAYGVYVAVIAITGPESKGGLVATYDAPLVEIVPTSAMADDNNDVVIVLRETDWDRKIAEMYNALDVFSQSIVDIREEVHHIIDHAERTYVTKTEFAEGMATKLSCIKTTEGDKITYDLVTG